MGTGASTQKEGEPLVYQDPEDGARFTQNEDSTELLFERDPVPWRNNCIFSESPMHLANGFSLTLVINGPGIVRIGLANENPQTKKSFAQSPIVTHEDGFKDAKNTRLLSVDAFGFLTYTDTASEKQKILAEIPEGTKAWFYLIVIQGRPKISVQKDRQPLKLKNIQPSNINIENDVAVPGHTSNSGVCWLKRPVVPGHTYCINWQMQLDQEDDGIHYCSSKKYGFFRLGVVSALPESLNKLSIYSENIQEQNTWFVNSSISSHCFNETLRITINKVAHKVSHNLTMSSATETVTEDFPLDCTKKLFLVMEVFHGDICGVQMYPADKAPKEEYPGHTLLFRDFKTDEGIPDHIQIGSKFKTEPCRIQYGTDPTIVLAEFRKKFPKARIKNLSETASLPWDSVEIIKETCKVQVFDVPDDTDDLETYFSNKSACGGGIIREKIKQDDIPGCWVITYKHRSDARAVWQEQQHRLDNSIVTVLPYYDQLGPTGNHGFKPRFDTSDLEIRINDKKKLDFMTTVGKRRFEKFMKKLKIGVVYPSVEQPEFEDENDSDNEDMENQIVLKCEIPLNEYQKLVSWKDNARKAVDAFISRILFWETTVDIKLWESVLLMLNEEKKSKEFVCTADKSERRIEILTTDQEVLSELKYKIESYKAPEDHVVENLEIDVFKYKMLDESGKLNKLETNNPRTSCTLDIKKQTLSLKGPVSEVSNMKTGILSLLTKVEKVALILNDERVRVLKSKMGRKLLEKELTKHNIEQKVEIRESLCEICVLVESSDSLRHTEKVLKTCINSILIEDKFLIPDNLVEPLQKVENIERVLRDIEQMNNNTVVLSLAGTELKCIGIVSAVQNAKDKLLQLLNGNIMANSCAYFQRNIVSYMDAYSRYFNIRNCTFLRDKDNSLTGEVYIEGKIEEIEQRKRALEKETEKISTFWFYLERPWLANSITNLDILQTLAETHQCLMQPEIGDTLADSAVSLVAVSKDGTAVQVIKCDMTVQDTDVIVNAANSELEMIGGLAKAISNAAGPAVQDECRKILHNNGKLAEGDAVFTNAGNLNCREILHVVGPMWKGGKENEKAILQAGVDKTLHMIAKKKYLSVMIPALSCGVFGYPNDLATEHIVEAICAFVLQNPDSTVKEVYLSDNRQDIVTHFENAVKKVLGRSWFIFQHKRPLKVTASHTTVDSKERSFRLRPKSGRPGQRTDDFAKSMKWGRNREKTAVPAQMSSSSDSSDGESRETPSAKPLFDLRTSELTDIIEEDDTGVYGLLMSMNLTRRTKLNIIKGRIETRQENVIVCTTPQFPNLVGAVANALIQKGGQSIVAECGQKGKLEFGEVVCTDKGSLQCKELFHVRTLMDWNNNEGPKNVQRIVEPCLRLADTRKHRSIAFPAIGTGASHYPADVVAEIMVKTLMHYFENNSNTSIGDVVIVIYERDTVTAQVFENVVPHLLATSEQTVNRKENPSSKNRSTVTTIASKTTNVHEPERVKGLRAIYVEPKNTEDHNQADDVVLIQVTTAGTRLDIIKQEAEKLLDNEFITKEIDFESLTDERRLDDEEVWCLKQLNPKKVTVDIDQSTSKVKIAGLRTEVVKAENDACNVLRTVFPQRRKQKKIESLIAQHVQWQVSDGSKHCKDVSQSVNFELEVNFERGIDFKYQSEGKEFQVLLTTMEEHPVGNPQMKRRLYRRIRADKGAGISIPEDWSISGTTDDYREIELAANDPTFNNVKKKFINAGCKPISIVKIKRIENRTLYLQYEILKRKITIRNPRGIQNERLLWHGSVNDTITLICSKGFNKGFAGKNATRYGEGVYFASESSFSHNYASPDGNGTRRMILARVLTGEYHLGSSDKKAPPVKTGQILYDSLVDNVNNPRIFVIFHDTQAYPEYLIEYT